MNYTRRSILRNAGRVFSGWLPARRCLFSTVWLQYVGLSLVNASIQASGSSLSERGSSAGTP